MFSIHKRNLEFSSSIERGDELTVDVFSRANKVVLDFLDEAYPL